MTGLLSDSNMSKVTLLMTLPVDDFKVNISNFKVISILHEYNKLFHRKMTGSPGQLSKKY